MIKKVILIILFSYCILLSGCLAHKEKTNTNDLQEKTSPQKHTILKENEEETMEKKLILTINDIRYDVTLYDTPAANALYDMLPLELTFEDFNHIEKIAYLNKKLPTKNEPDGFEPHIGDLCLYAPWGNLSIFYKDFRYSDSLISLGRIDSGIEDISSMKDNFSARLERMEFIVNSGRKGFRYFDLEAIEQSDFLERIDFNRYQEKCISSLLIFNDYSDLMNEFLIRNEYELHNILKWLDSKNYFLYPDISFGRMPMIEFDGFKKEDMVEHLIHESDGLTVEEFLEKLYAEYGYRQDTFLNVVVTGFPNYISNGIIVDNDLLSLDDETKLKEILVNDFYFFEEFKNLVESKDVPFEKMTL